MSKVHNFDGFCTATYVTLHHRYWIRKFSFALYLVNNTKFCKVVLNQAELLCFVLLYCVVLVLRCHGVSEVDQEPTVYQLISFHFLDCVAITKHFVKSVFTCPFKLNNLYLVC